jgi:hypothetical protein
MEARALAACQAIIEIPIARRSSREPAYRNKQESPRRGRVRKRDANRKPRMMYRDERLEVHFNVKVTREMRQALREGAIAEGMRDAQFARMVLDLGLVVWRPGGPIVQVPAHKSYQQLRQRVTYRALGGGFHLDLQMSLEMRAALGAGADAEGVQVSEFARRAIGLGLAAWREQRAPKTRAAGAT